MLHSTWLYVGKTEISKANLRFKKQNFFEDYFAT